MNNPPVLLFNAPRDTYRPIIVAEDELYTSPMALSAPRCVPRPVGPFDATVYIKSLPAPYNDPSLVLCDYDSSGQNVAQNLAGIKCPKVLLVGDTHHMHAPIARAVRAALAEPWDMVVLQYNRQHCHWFTEAGVKNVQWIPCFQISPFNMPPKPRTRGVTFAGGFGCHPYRVQVLKAIAEAGIKVEWGTGTREQCARLHNESLISLNVSLNGDFNLRNFEVMAAGGCLLTDELSGESGQDELGGCFATSPWSLFDCAHYLVARIKFLQNNPSETMAIAQRGYDYFWNNHSPAHKIAELHACLAGKQTWTDARTALPTGDVWERIRVYEQLQEMHRLGTWERHALDASDLVRFKEAV